MDSKTVGILGGGQLGRMIVEAAHRLNIKTVILDAPHSPAKQINALDAHVDGLYTDAGAIAALARRCDVLTVEIEHVDADAVQRLHDETGIAIYPLPETIRLIQDKFVQKQHLAQHGVAVVELVAVADAALVARAGAQWGYPLMLKLRTLAYDGRGNFVVERAEQCPQAVAALAGATLYAERWCPFDKELAVMVVRALDGAVHAYPTVETIHRRNICHVVHAPARVAPLVAARAQTLAQNAVKLFPGCGIFGVEMFLLPLGELLVNEVAPRPHNLGHYTLDACVTLQFEAHVRAVVGLPMPRGFTAMASADTHAVMLNVLGGDEPNAELAACRRALETPHASVYLYGKQTRPGRKMGHINIVLSSAADCEARLAHIEGGADAPPPPPLGQAAPLVGIIMGLDSDLPVMALGAAVLKKFGVPFELTIVSAHRTPQRMAHYAAAAAERGLKCIIAGAGGAAHLPGMVAAMTPLPVIGVPVKGLVLDGVDSLHLIVQMPRGVPVATVAINNSTNAALLAVRMLAAYEPRWMQEMKEYMAGMEREVLEKAERLEEVGYEKY
jgi:phosphoribosylaminoimidazole carboxylase